MRKTLALWIFVGLISSWGCIMRTHHTIEAHVVVEIKRVEEQVDDVLDFVTGQIDVLPQPAAAPPPSSRLREMLYALHPMPSAYAQDSPAIQEIAGRMRERYAKISEHKKNGCFGESNRGLLELRECDALGDAAAKNDAQKLMADENKDRKALYQEMARVNASQTVAEIAEVTARKWFERAQKGEWVQLPPQGPNFDACRASANGKALGDACVPGAWVQIP